MCVWATRWADGYVGLQARAWARKKRAGKFEVTFLDSAMRVTRGDREELRIYIRDTQGAVSKQMPPPDYDD
eukprot:364616-Chlamydomonas_euryale.AAC.6